MEFDYRFITRKNYNLIEKCFKHYIPSYWKDDVVVVYGAFFQNEIIGVIVLHTNNAVDFTVVFFEILPLFRGVGVGSILLKKVVNYCKIHKKRNITMCCNSKQHNITSVNRFLRKNNWHELSYNYSKYIVEQSLINSRYFRNMTSLNIKNYRLHDFCQLNKHQIDEVNTEAYSLEGMELSLSKSSTTIIPDLSYFIEVDNKFIAWLIIDNINNKELLVRHTFVMPQYRNNGVAFYLWLLALDTIRKNKVYRKFKFVSFEFHNYQPKLLKLYNLLFGNVLHAKITYYHSVKNLK